jgi:integrase/recombinase XerD
MTYDVFQTVKTAPSRGLYDQRGQRKYLTPAEREAFLRAADDSDRQVRTLCYVLAHTGCRISEALALTADRVDLKGGSLIFESLKKRRTGVFRPVPIPPDLLDALNLVHDLRTAQRRRDRGRGVRLWPFARNTAWRHVGAVMKAAKIAGLHATPKGLRHGFGIKAVTVGVPLNMVQRWLGHAQLSTTAIYADAQGAEAAQLAARMWE